MKIQFSMSVPLIRVKAQQRKLPLLMTEVVYQRMILKEWLMRQSKKRLTMNKPWKKLLLKTILKPPFIMYVINSRTKKYVKPYHNKIGIHSNPQLTRISIGSKLIRILTQMPTNHNLKTSKMYSILSWLKCINKQVEHIQELPKAQTMHVVNNNPVHLDHRLMKLIEEKI